MLEIKCITRFKILRERDKGFAMESWQLAKDMNPLEPVGHIPAPLWGSISHSGLGTLPHILWGKFC